jgi:tellurite resistance protein
MPHLTALRAFARRTDERTTMIEKTLAGALIAWCLLVPALADEATPDDEGGRYAFSKQADGILRLDKQTGDVSLCTQRTVGWACQAVPDDRVALESEIARLRRENAALKKDILARGLPLPAGATAEPPATSENRYVPRLNENPDVERVLAFAQRLWHRLVDVIARAEKQLKDKS